MRCNPPGATHWARRSIEDQVATSKAIVIGTLDKIGEKSASRVIRVRSVLKGNTKKARIPIDVTFYVLGNYSNPPDDENIWILQSDPKLGLTLRPDAVLKMDQLEYIRALIAK